MFNKETYIQRRNRLKKEIGKGILLFLGNNESGMNYADNTYHFRQDSTFLYFFGSDYAGLSALIDIDEGREIIFGDELTIDDIVWMGTQPTIREKSASVGITATAPTAQLSDYLNKAVQQGRRIHYLPPYRGEHQVTLLRLLGIAPEAQVAGASTELIRAVVGQRNYKSAEEIREIEEAVNISADMHIRAMQLVRPGMKECEIAAAVTEVALQNGGQLSFPVIATINGQTLHNHYHGNILHEGQLLLLDAGAENGMHYSGDLSSTIPVSKHFTEQQKTEFSMQKWYDLSGKTAVVTGASRGIGRAVALRLAKDGNNYTYNPVKWTLKKSDKKGESALVTNGTLEGDIVPGDITFFRLQGAADCKLQSYIAQGEVLPVATRSFGGIGVFAIPEMKRFYRHVLVAKHYPHHGAVGFAHVGKVLFEAMKLMGVPDIAFNQPKGMLYKDENPFA